MTIVISVYKMLLGKFLIRCLFSKIQTFQIYPTKNGKNINFFNEQEGVLLLPGVVKGFAFSVHGLGQLTCVLTLPNQKKQ